MLDYENQIFLDVLNEDALVVTAKGLGVENVFLNLLKVYSDPGNLVLVLGTNAHEDRYFINHLAEQGSFPLPRVITSESGSSAERTNLYLEGGVLFVSPRILVVDLLKDRLPAAHVTGIMVYRAQSVVRSCQEAFALRLYRQKNKTGFVKAFSSSAQALTAGFAQVSRIMRMLFLKKLFLWPRFQAIVQSSLGTFKPTVIEMHVQLTPAMNRIQNAILDLMAFTVKELRRINPAMDLDELTVENAIAKSFHKVLQLQLDPVWHQLSSKTKALVADLKVFRVILTYLIRYDCVTFNSFVSSFRSQSYAVSSSGWLLLDSANVLFTVSKQRVMGETTKAKDESSSPKGSGKGQEKSEQSKKAKRRILPSDRETEVTSAGEDKAEAKVTRPSKISRLSLSQRTVATTGGQRVSKLSLSQATTGGQRVSKLSLSQATAARQTQELLEKLKKGVTPPKSKPLQGIVEDSDSDDVDGELEGKKEEDGKKPVEVAGVNSVDPEPSPKWTVLKQILAEIKEMSKTSGEESSLREKVLILVEDKRTAKQLQDFLVLGAREMLLNLHKRASERKTSAPGRGFVEQNVRSPTKLFQTYRSHMTEGLEVELSTQMMSKHGDRTPERKRGIDLANSDSSPEKGEVTPTKEDGRESSGEVRKSPAESPGDVPKSPDKEEPYSDVYVLSQKLADSNGRDGSKPTEEEAYEVVANQTKQLDESLVGLDASDSAASRSPLLIIQTFKTNGDPLSLPQTLEDLQPRFIVMYDVEVSVIRRIEVYQGLNPRIQVQVYFVVFGGSVEEQAYLTALRREKEAFDYLINEKATMVIPEDQDGKSDLCEALSRDASKPSAVVNTRRGGDDLTTARKQSTIVVDMREFNSELPAMIHRRGIDVEPVTLQVGDYILSPEICVERKSVSDLIGSLNHGRLYNQAKAMTRYYASPILLIEFDQNKPMTLQGNYYISNDMSSNDVSSKLILLTLHFPQLRIVWSPSPFATAQLFEELKQVREEPDPLKAAEVGADLEQDLDVAERYNPGIHDLVARLPGVTTKNIHSVLNRGVSLDHLVTLSKEELTKMMENSQEAESLHEGFHEKFKPVDMTDTSSKRGGARWRGRGRGFRR